MGKTIKMFICMGSTENYQETFSRVMEEFTDKFKKDGIIGEYCVFSQQEIESACEGRDGEDVSKELKDSRLILFITEEQGHEIKEDMSTFFQKVSLWCYTMPMIGKLGILVSVCNEKELLITTNYMTKLLLSWGSGIVGKLIFHNGISDQMELKKQIRAIEERIKEIYDEESFKVADSQIANFEINKQVISELDDNEYLKQYWKKNKYLDAKDFQYLFDSKFLA